MGIIGLTLEMVITFENVLITKESILWFENLESQNNKKMPKYI